MWMMFLSCIVASSGSRRRHQDDPHAGARETSPPRAQHAGAPEHGPPVKVGHRHRQPVVFAVLAFVFLYFMSVVTLVFVQLASGLDFLTAFSSSSRASTMRPRPRLVDPAATTGC